MVGSEVELKPGMSAGMFPLLSLERDSHGCSGQLASQDRIKLATQLYEVTVREACEPIVGQNTAQPSSTPFPTSAEL